MFRLFECCALSFFERFVLSFSLKIERFVSDSAEIWICGLYYITFALKNGSKINEVAIAFKRDNGLPAEFEIQLSGGGGQFLTVYSGTVSQYGELISYPFKGTTASDLRILLNDDRVGIAEVVLKE